MANTVDHDKFLIGTTLGIAALMITCLQEELFNLTSGNMWGFVCSFTVWYILLIIIFDYKLKVKN